ncbi:Phage integrase family protein [Malonomonas rubra DSM 5091]|uniref:Phage integrase family protein n=2 Tax=Malonomonas rubra TaxID=57040 RepID=A0A1M6B9H6_MALRU|nr:Phage integrase family protein [Malonomonas rubra DSM 5091]
MSYIKSIKGLRLWPNLSPDKYGKYGKVFGNKYGKINRELIPDTKKCFHSFRHTVADTLKQAGVNETLIIELLGHDDPQITTGRYGKRHRPKALLKDVFSVRLISLLYSFFSRGVFPLLLICE